MNDFSGAIADYSRSIELSPDLDMAYFNRGLARVNMRQRSEAIADFTKAISLNPDYKEAYYYRGALNVDAGNFNSVITDLNKAIGYNIKPACFLFIKGLCKICAALL